MKDLLIRGGTLATAADVFEADLLVRDGRIATIGSSLRADGAEEIDARGLLVLPGGIDTHVHLAHPIDRLGIETADDFASGTRAAAFGGTTTVIDFALQRKGDSILDVARKRRELAARDARVDFGLHIIVTDVRDDVVADVPKALAEGFSSYKVYLTYSDKYVDDGGLIRVLEATQRHGGLAYVHCENHFAAQHLIGRALEEGRHEAHHHASTRPPLVEAEAVHRAITLARLMGAPIAIAHVTSSEALGVLEAARHEGARAFGETCPQYLTLTSGVYDPGPEVSKYVCTPPIRDVEHQTSLWAGLRRGGISWVSSDHAPFVFKTQKKGAKDFTKVPNGVPGVETRLALLYSEGVGRGRISVERFVDLIATQPAKIFGLYPQKGSLSIGADADIVLLDPRKSQTISHSKLHHNVDYTPYEGRSVTGWPVTTILRGEVLVRNGEWLASASRGRFIARSPRTSNS